MQRQYAIALKMIFPTLYNTPQLNLTPIFKGLVIGIKLKIWLSPFLLIITHANQI